MENNNKKSMDEFDKIDKLKQRAGVSYAEAGEALRACDGDLLDAMVYLERQGKVNTPEQPSYSTSSEEQTSYENVPEAVERSRTENSDPSFGEQLGHLLKTALQKSLDNFLVVSHRGEEKFRVPILVLILAFLFFNVFAVIVLVVSLFFDVRYNFTGKDDLSSVNKVMDEAGAKATDWMNESYRQSHRNSTSEADRQRERAERRADHFAEKAERRADHFAEKAERRADRYAEKAEKRKEYWENKSKEWADKAANKFGDSKNDSAPEDEAPHEPLKTYESQEIEELTKKYDDTDKDGKK